MKTEKIVISFIAVIVGILVAGVSFYLYQATKIIPDEEPKKSTASSPSKETTQQEQQATTVFLTVDAPKDEEVVDRRTLSINGKTLPDATIVITSPIADEVVTPTASGNFATTVQIDDGENIVEIIAVAPNGQEQAIKRTVTYSTESF